MTKQRQTFFGYCGSLWLRFGVIGLAIAAALAGITWPDSSLVASAQGNNGPTVTSIEISSTPKASGWYGSSETIDVKVTFSAAITGTVTIDADNIPPDAGPLGPYVELNVGGVTKKAKQSNIDDEVITFSYTVQEGDADDNGVSVGANTLQMGNTSYYTAVYKDADGNEADLTHSALSDDSSHKVGSRPKVDSVAITSSPHVGDTYGFNETIRVTVTFNEAVEKRGTPTILLGLSGDGNFYNMSYDSGSDSESLVFKFTVGSDHSDTDGITIRKVGLAYTMTIRSTTTGIGAKVNFQDLTDADHKVDGSVTNPAPPPPDTTAPIIESVAFLSQSGGDRTYKTGEVVTMGVTFSESIVVTGAPQLELDFAGTAKTAEYSGINDGKVAKFDYTVQSGDSAPDGIAVGADKLTLNGGTIKDAADNDADLTHSAVPASSGGWNRVGPLPDIDIEITSSPANGDTYVAGEDIEITLTFEENVQTSGNPRLVMEHQRLAHVPMKSSSGSEVVFSYEVPAGVVDSDGISIWSGNRNAYGGGNIVSETTGNVMYANYPGLDNESGHKIDSAAPTVSSISITSDPGDNDTYGLDDKIEVTVTFSENVTVTGTPQLELDVGGTAKTASYESVSGAAVVFGYTVAGGDADSDGISISANKLTLNGGTINDAASNAATLSHDAVATDDGHKVWTAGGL